MALTTLYWGVAAPSSILNRHLTSCFMRVNVAVHTRRRAHCGINPRNPFIKVSEEVREAIESRRPVVALETAIYTHGD